LNSRITSINIELRVKANVPFGRIVFTVLLLLQSNEVIENRTIVIFKIPILLNMMINGRLYDINRMNEIGIHANKIFFFIGKKKG